MFGNGLLAQESDGIDVFQWLHLQGGGDETVAGIAESQDAIVAVQRQRAEKAGLGIGERLHGAGLHMEAENVGDAGEIRTAKKRLAVRREDEIAGQGIAQVKLPDGGHAARQDGFGVMHLQRVPAIDPAQDQCQQAAIR